MSIRALAAAVPLAALFAAGVARGQDEGAGGAMAGGSATGRDAAAMMARYGERIRVVRPCPRAAPGEVVVSPVGRKASVIGCL